MTPFLYAVSGAAVLLVVVLVWALRRPSAGRRNPWALDEHPRSHMQYFPQIQQALGRADRDFLRARGGAGLARSVKRERHKVARDFLRGLDEEFRRLLRLARIIAALSPEVVTLQEVERLRLTVMFRWRFQVICVRLALGATALPEVQAMSDMVSRLTVRMEAAMRDLGERATLAAELASTLDGSDLHAV